LSFAGFDISEFEISRVDCSCLCLPECDWVAYSFCPVCFSRPYSHSDYWYTKL